MREKLADSLKKAMLDKNAVRVATLRLILAAIKDRDIAARGDAPAEARQSGIDDVALISLLGTMIKQRKESIQAYEEGGRLELAEREQQEIDIISEFLPPQLDEKEVEQAIKEALTETDAETIRDMGAVMSLLKERYAGRMDFSIVGANVRKALS